MSQTDQNPGKHPQFSIIIAVYNDWQLCEGCLKSLEQQQNGPSFEVIIVDDGSKEAAPSFIESHQRFYSLLVIRQPHAGVAAARNRGVRLSRGAVLVFVDADSRFQSNCLRALDSIVGDSSTHDAFQLRLIGDCSSLVGRAEELRLRTLQTHALLPDGRIRYLNTAGFAIRRARIDVEQGIFDPCALRAEDTLLLAALMQNGELPLFVSNAIIQHAIPLSLLRCLLKDIRSAYLERRPYRVIGSKGISVRMNHRERFRMLLSTWETSGQRSIGRSGWAALITRQMLQRLISFVYRCS